MKFVFKVRKFKVSPIHPPLGDFKISKLFKTNIDSK
jgi:hypothetical protein